jgi:vancomycin resistance protein YoaR
MAESTSDKAKRVRAVLIWANVAIGCLALFAVLIGGTMVAYAHMYDGRIFPGVSVLGVRLDGMTKDDAQKAVQEAIDRTLAGGLRFRFHGKEVSVDPTPSSPDAGDSRDLILYNVNDALQQALTVGREGNWLQQSFTQVRLRGLSINIPAAVTIDRAGIASGISAALQDQLTSPVDAHFAIDATSTPVKVTIVSEKDGSVLLPDQAMDTLSAEAQYLDFKPIDISDRAVTPTITAKDLEPLLGDAQAMFTRPQLVFTYQDKQFPVPTTVLATWVSATGTKDALSVALDPAAFAASLPTIAPGVEVQPKDGSLVEKDGKIQSFVSGTEGQVIDATATFAEVARSWPASSTFPLVVTSVTGKLAGDDPQRLGITDLLGVGISNYRNSPPNRIKNIQHGVALVNGTIVQPGETFSLIKTLGPIDGEHQWLSELTIKGDHTEPDFGGGLCQIGTTTFRAALASGLPILERQNHSYSVSYYAPAGTDATIYDPQPDMRFKNDTLGPILINAYIKGTGVYFEFWGKKDGRSATYTGVKTVTQVTDLVPRVSNVVQPPPPKLTETLSLPPGTKKCSELPHAGEDAIFTYTVTSATGTVSSVDFQSHYRPWQEVCLIGVSQLSQPQASSTDSGVN